MTNDLIGDSLIRIKNATIRRHETVELYYSKVVLEVCRVLKEKKRIASYEMIETEGNEFNTISVQISDRMMDDLKVIKDVKRISKPGIRIYRGYKKLPPVLNGYGFAIISTAKGVFTDKQARENKVGGEVLCEIY